MSDIRIDFSACIVTGGEGLRERVESASKCYAPESAYFDELFAKNGAAFEESACAFLLLDSMVQSRRIDRSAVKLLRTEKGRPYAEGAELDISLSHSDGCAFCAIATGAGVTKGVVGADIQRERDYSNEKMSELAMAFMTEEELAAFYYAEDKRGEFFTAWTRREAHAKRIGEDILDHIGGTDLSGENFREGIINCCGAKYYYCIDTAAEETAADEENI